MEFGKGGPLTPGPSSTNACESEQPNAINLWFDEALRMTYKYPNSISYGVTKTVFFYDSGWPTCKHLINSKKTRNVLLRKVLS